MLRVRVQKSSVRAVAQQVHDKPMRLSVMFHEALEACVTDLMQRAAQRARLNGRNIIRAEDL